MFSSNDSTTVFSFFFFFFNDLSTTEIYTLSLHDALPISGRRDDRYFDWGGNLRSGAAHRAVGSGDAFLFVGDHRLCDFRECGIVFRVLPGEPGGEPRPD